MEELRVGNWVARREANGHLEWDWAIYMNHETPFTAGGPFHADIYMMRVRPYNTEHTAGLPQLLGVHRVTSQVEPMFIEALKQTGGVVTDDIILALLVSLSLTN